MPGAMWPYDLSDVVVDRAGPRGKGRGYIGHIPSVFREPSPALYTPDEMLLSEALDDSPRATSPAPAGPGLLDAVAARLATSDGRDINYARFSRSPGGSADALPASRRPTRSQ